MRADHLYLILPVGLVLAALGIFLALWLGRRRRTKKHLTDPYALPYVGSGGAFFPAELEAKGESGPLERTLDAYLNPEETIAEDELTIDARAQRGVELVLELQFAGRNVQINRTFTEQLTLGRGGSCDVDVVLGEKTEDARQTSRVHASILNRPEGLFLRDEGARNGTSLNGQEVTQEVPLRDKDRIGLGKAQVCVRVIRA